MVAWCWDASDPPNKGFEIINYTGNSIAGRTVAHTLNGVPAFIIVKEKTSVNNWFVCYHSHLTSPATTSVSINSARRETANNYWNNTLPTTTQVTLGGVSVAVNDNGVDYSMYLWKEIPGYSKMHYYIGNGSAQGPWVYCGFRPGWLMIKSRDNSSFNWIIVDDVRDPENGNTRFLYPNLTNQEVLSATILIDFQSTGFKLWSDNGAFNGNGNQYIFVAFAHAPWGGADNTPVLGR